MNIDNGYYVHEYSSIKIHIVKNKYMVCGLELLKISLKITTSADNVLTISTSFYKDCIVSISMATVS